MQDTTENNALIIAAFAAIYLIWGSTYLAALIGLEALPPFLLMGLRFMVAGVLLYGWRLLKGDSFPSYDQLKRSAVSGTLMLFGGTGSVIWAEQHLPTGIAAILVTTLPFWLILLDRQQWTYYFRNKWIVLGLLLGFTGILLLFGGNTVAGKPVDAAMVWVSAWVVVAGTICWAVGSLYIRYQAAPGSTMMNASTQLLAAGVISLLVSWLIGEFDKFGWSEVTLRAWLALGYMIVMGSLVAYLSYLWLLRMRPPAVVGTYTYVNPVIAVALGWLFASESVSGRQLIALLVILAGVLLVNLPKYQKKKTAAFKNA